MITFFPNKDTGRKIIKFWQKIVMLCAELVFESIEAEDDLK